MEKLPKPLHGPARYRRGHVARDLSAEHRPAPGSAGGQRDVPIPHADAAVPREHHARRPVTQPRSPPRLSPRPYGVNVPISGSMSMPQLIISGGARSPAPPGAPAFLGHSCDGRFPRPPPWPDRLFGVNVPAMSLKLHEWEIRADCAGTDGTRMTRVRLCVRDRPHRTQPAELQVHDRDIHAIARASGLVPPVTAAYEEHRSTRGDTRPAVPTEQARAVWRRAPTEPAPAGPPAQARATARQAVMSLSRSSPARRRNTTTYTTRSRTPAGYLARRRAGGRSRSRPASTGSAGRAGPR